MTTHPDRADKDSNDVPFGIEQLFYSRTDKRGVIRAGNQTFQTLAGYDWAKLLGAPHKIIRNPETPRAVFRVMWQMIQRDEPTVAYVRNKAQDGRGYWVVAVVLPLADGYLSIRIKPTSPFFTKVKALYAAQTTAETEEHLTVDDAENRLTDAITALGFADYRAFMAHGIWQEFVARDTARDQRCKEYLTDAARIRDNLVATLAHQDDLLRNFDRLRDLPTNMRILASRLEPSGGPISAISDIYNSTSSELFHEISAFARGKKSISLALTQAFEDAVFLKICALLQAEVIQQFRAEPDLGSGVDHAAETTILADLGLRCNQMERAGLIKSEQLAIAMNQASSDLRRSMLGLDTIRVMGRVESGRLGAEGSRIGATIDQLDTYHSSIIALLQKIMDNAVAINSGVGNIRAQTPDHPAIAAR
ncbi:MAG: PAS domain S-box protein [bacterium]